MTDKSTRTDSTVSSTLALFVVSLLLWLGLVGSIDGQELMAGLLVAAILTALFYRRVTIFSGLRYSWKMPYYILAYLLDFCRALFVANIDLAQRVLAPSLPIRPEVVQIEVGLQSDLGRLLLANTITLTPGTLSVDYDGNRLTVHWVYSPPGLNAQQVSEKIAGRFETLLARFVR